MKSGSAINQLTGPALRVEGKGNNHKMKENREKKKKRKKKKKKKNRKKKKKAVSVKRLDEICFFCVEKRVIQTLYTNCRVFNSDMWAQYRAYSNLILMIQYINITNTLDG